MTAAQMTLIRQAWETLQENKPAQNEILRVFPEVELAPN